MPENRELELEEDMAFQQREWLIQRVSWVLWFCILTAALAGLIGPGPLSGAESSTTNGLLTVGYERFLHYHQPTKLDVWLGPTAQVGNPARIKLSQGLLDRVQVLRIEPEPTSREIAEDGVVYTFPHNVTTGNGKLTFHLEYEKPGTTAGSITLVGHEPVTFKQFVYP